MNVLAGLLIFCIFLNFGMYFILVPIRGMRKTPIYLIFIFGSTTLPYQLESFFFYEPPKLAGLAGHSSGHTSRTVQAELLPVLENTMYMIVTCTQSQLNVSVGF
jgi:hypothetical protein